MAGRGAGSAAPGAARRQRAHYDHLWGPARPGAASPDLIRFRVWRPHLESPVIDIGAGDALLSRCFPDHQVLSLDLSCVGLRQARGPAMSAAAEAVPVRDGAARSIVLSEVLEHAEDPKAVLAECWRVLRDDGVLLMSVPTWPLSTSERLYHWRRLGERPTLDNLSRWDPNHERRYRLDDLVSEVVCAGFVVNEVAPLFGSASSALLYGLEPLVARFSGRQPRLAQRVSVVDRMLRPIDHSSAVALVCYKRRGHLPPVAAPDA